MLHRRRVTNHHDMARRTCFRKQHYIGMRRYYWLVEQVLYCWRAIPVTVWLGPAVTGNYVQEATLWLYLTFYVSVRFNGSRWESRKLVWVDWYLLSRVFIFTCEKVIVHLDKIYAMGNAENFDVDRIDSGPLRWCLGVIRDTPEWF